MYISGDGDLFIYLFITFFLVVKSCAMITSFHVLSFVYQKLIKIINFYY